MLGVLLTSNSLVQAQGRFGVSIPQTADFIKYGETPVALYNGNVHVEVPIYEYKDRDFTLPIVARYTSDAFMPEKHAGYIGLNWHLDVGGVITREVYGAPDDASNYYWNEASRIKGFLVAIREGRKYTQSEIYNLTSRNIEPIATMYDLVKINGQEHDYQPDLFSFNFCGKTGRFVIGNDGIPVCSQDGFKVDVSQVSAQPYEFARRHGLNSSIIKITTPDGFQYYFGGDRNMVEYSFHFEDNSATEANNLVILSWYLTKIVAPNGREVIFKYAREDFFNKDYTNHFHAFRYLAPNIKTGQYEPKYKATHAVFLDSIIVGATNAKIAFKKSVEQTSNFYTSLIGYQRPSYQLDEIAVKFGYSTPYSFKFTYEVKSGKRRFLSSINQVGLPGYKFTYYHPAGSYPEPTTPALDDYNYWTGGETDAGLLTKVEYPSGGYSVFTFESHSYTKKVATQLLLVNQRFVVDNRLRNSFYSIMVSGMRIQSITHYDSDWTKIKELKYTYQDGTLLRSLPYTTLINDTEVTLHDAWDENYNIGEPHMGYSEVKEQYTDNSYVTYRFSDYTLNPDLYEGNCRYSIDASNHPIEGFELIANYLGRRNSNSYKRGHLLRKTYYNSHGAEVKKEAFEYMGVNSDNEQEFIGMPSPSDLNYDDKYVVRFRALPFGCVSNKIYVQSCPLLSKVEKTKFESGYLKDITRYKYNESGLLKEQTRTRDGVIHKNAYRYPSDYGAANPYYEMVNRHMLSPVVEQAEYLEGSKLSTTKNNYKLFNNIPVVDIVQLGTGNSSLEDRVQYHNYDSYGNPLYVTKDNDEKVVYLWSYGGQYLVAKIENATYSQINGYISLEALSRAIVPDMQQVEALRSILALSHTLITSYEYEPLVGVRKVTDPRGVTTYYKYDGFGRLTFEEDHNRNIIKAYDYSYTNR